MSSDSDDSTGYVTIKQVHFGFTAPKNGVPLYSKGLYNIGLDKQKH